MPFLWRKETPLAAKDHFIGESDALLFARRILVRSAAQTLALGTSGASTGVANHQQLPAPALPANAIGQVLTRVER
jgi:hypothetical protein